MKFDTFPYKKEKTAAHASTFLGNNKKNRKQSRKLEFVLKYLVDFAN